LTAALRLDSAHRGWRIVRFGAIDSTNEEARRRALAGAADRLWIVADEQTAGRGRRGRAWISPKGNLHASALMIDPCPPAVAAQLGFVAGVALVRAAKDLGATDIGLKWPNDLMSHGAKCAGILVEGVGLGGGRAACVVGVGANCAHAPHDLGYATSCLTRTGGQAVGPGELLERLVERFGEALDAWRFGQAFDRIRAAWLDYALGLGERIAIQNGAGRREGVFEGIDAAGRLLMRSERGLERIEAADLWLSPRLGALPPSVFSVPTGRKAEPR
jgi:BirA family transcriptional regulator, biotin operon repressor / biotin---[acetyl-CoA-carboxylase] ligase